MHKFSREEVIAVEHRIYISVHLLINLDHYYCKHITDLFPYYSTQVFLPNFSFLSSPSSSSYVSFKINLEGKLSLSRTLILSKEGWLFEIETLKNKSPLGMYLHQRRQCTCHPF